MSRPRIAICGVHIESSTFSPHHSTDADFEQRSGRDLIHRYPFLTPGSELGEAADYVPIFHARALPGGAVTPETYERFKTRIVEGLRDAGPLEGILFDIHGAMSVLGLDDAEGDLVTAIRAVVGPEPVISAPMDLHGNVSTVLFAACDLLTCYRTAPHVDVWETRERALRQLLDALTAGRRPHKALVHVPVLLPGEMTSTRLEPAASLYARIPTIEQRPGIIDASIWIGFAWADEPRCQAAIVVTGTDADVVEHEALALADEFWQARHDFCFVAPTDTFDNCLRRAMASPRRPFFISDSGDNPGAGGADDCTYTLAALASEPRIAAGEVTALLASIVDANTVARAEQFGVGAVADFVIGGHIDAREPGPQTLRCRVEQISSDARGGRVARLSYGGLQILVTSVRDQYASTQQYLAAGVDPATVDIVVVKMGYLEPDLFALQQDWLLALTPGGVDQDLRRLGHHRIERPMIPMDAEVPRPVVLTARG